MVEYIDIDNTLTFRYYLMHYNSDLINQFIHIFGENVINKLPNNICSSKTIHNLLEQDLDTNLKKNLFNKTFMEYFKLKIEF